MAKTIAMAFLHMGHGRCYSEDNLYILDQYVKAEQSTDYEQASVSSDPLQLFAVADGIGGSGIGDVASRAAMRVLDRQRQRLRPHAFDFETFARETVKRANQSVCEQLKDYEGLRVGTTCSILAVHQDKAYTISLGNSRIYLFRDNRLIRLTEDHISRLPDYHPMSRNLGFLTDSAILESENITSTTLQPGDILLLSTDGVTNNLDEAQIAAELASPGVFTQMIRHLRERVLEAGGRDNLALVAVKIQDPAVNGPSRPRRKSRDVVGRLASQTDAYLSSGPSAVKWLRPLLFFLLFALLGMALGRIFFLIPALLGKLSSLGGG